MIVKVETLKEWENVIRLALSKGFRWESFEPALANKINPHLFETVKGSREVPVYVRLGKTEKNILANVIGWGKDEVVLTADEYLSTIVYKVTPQEFKLLNIIKEHDGQTLLRAISENWRWLQNLHAIGTSALLKWFANDPNVNIEAEQPKYILWSRDDDRIVYYAKGHGVPTYVRSQSEAHKFDTEEEAEQTKNNFWTVMVDDI